MEGETTREAEENAGLREYATCEGVLASLCEGLARVRTNGARGVVTCALGRTWANAEKAWEQLTLTNLEKIQLRAMRLKQLRVLLIAAIVAAITAAGCSCCKTPDVSNRDREALEKTSEGILAAFRRGDAATILAYHHPDVVKALSFQKTVNVGTHWRRIQQFNLEWKENRVVSILIHGDTAVEQTVFAIQGTPKNGGQVSLFKGRAQVVYVRYKKSPTGWASVRELVQPAT